MRRAPRNRDGRHDEGTGKTRARARADADPRQEARGRAQRRHDPDPEDRDLRHRHPHLEVGRLGAEDDPRADARRPRVRRRDRRDGAGGARLRARRPRLGRGPHHLRLLPQLPRRAPAPVPQHGRRRRQPRGRVRRVPGDPGVQRVPDSRRHLRRPGVDLRSVRQRDAHGAVVQPGRRGRADHRRGPDRHHGRGDRPPRRRAPRRHHRRQRLPAGPGAADGRDARGQRRPREPARRDGRPAA